MVYALKAGYSLESPRLGSYLGDERDEAAMFRDDMVSFWTAALS